MRYFLISLACGVLSGVAYDVLYIVRRVIAGRWPRADKPLTYVSDGIYALVLAAMFIGSSAVFRFPDMRVYMVLACLLGLRFEATGLHTLRIKETDRIDALRSQLLKLGYAIEVREDCSIYYDGTLPRGEVRRGIVIETFEDHRMAMAFATASLKHPGLVIADAGVVSKSYPDFWEHLAACGFGLKEVEL